MKDIKKTEEVVSRIEKTIAELKEKKSVLYFFVIDSKDVPNGSMGYIYELAKVLKDKGYNICMLYQLDNEYKSKEIKDIRLRNAEIDDNRYFRGVENWLGKEYSELPHKNIQNGDWSVSPSDFLFIPEAFSSFMFQTYKHNIPCKRYVILHNFDYVTEFIPLGIEWANYGIYDAITTTNFQKERIKEVFPYMNVSILNPFIKKIFRKGVAPQKLIVNIIAKKQSDVNNVVKPFFWKYPLYRFVSFRDLRGFPQSMYADLLKEGAITIWIDEDTSFGYSALEAMRCGNIIIGKFPENTIEWAEEEKDGKYNIRENAIWVNKTREIPDILAEVVDSWLRDEIPSELYDEMDKTNQKYTEEKFSTDVDVLFEDIFNKRIKEIESVLETMKSSEKEESTEQPKEEKQKDKQK